jgi:PilZ domain
MMTLSAASALEDLLSRSNRERRRHQRVKVVLPGRYMLEDRREFECQTIDMSPGGVALAAPERGEEGSRVVVYLNEIGRIEGRVARHTEQGFALSLDASRAKRERLAEQLTWLANRRELGMREDRRHERLTPQRLRSTLILPDGKERWAVIIDLSRSGVALRSDFEPELGASLVIGATLGRVVRKFPGGFALEFVRLIPAEQFGEDTVL